MNSSNANASNPSELRQRRNTLQGVGRKSLQAALEQPRVREESGVREVPKAWMEAWLVRDGGWRM